MKKPILLTASLAVLCLTANAQEKFTGIGIFKVGSDSSAVFEYAKSKKLKVKTLPWAKSQMPDFYRIKNTFAKIIDDNKYASPKCPYETQYFLSSYEVDGILLENITLMYYKNQLEKLECRYSKQVVDAMEVKYGEISTQVIKDTSKCVYRFTGNQRDLVSTSYVKSKYFGKIYFFSHYGMSFDNNCNDMAFSSFSYELWDDDRAICERYARLPKDNKPDKLQLKHF